MFNKLQQAGICMLASMIVGFDWHDEKTVEEDFQYLLSIRPTLSQIMIYSPCPQTPLFKKFEKEGRLLEIPYIQRDGFHLMFKHPHFSAEKIEKLLIDFFRREYEELGPSIFRIQEVQLAGYNYLKDSEHPLLKARQREQKRLCLDIYPLLITGIRHAPSEKIKKHLKELKEKVENTFEISGKKHIEAQLATLLYLITKMKQRLNSHVSVKSEIKYYNA